MPQCVTIDSTGHAVASAADPCDGYVLVTANEYGLLQALQMPTATEVGAVFALGFSVVVFSYLTAWGAQVVISMFGDRRS